MIILVYGAVSYLRIAASILYSFFLNFSIKMTKTFRQYMYEKQKIRMLKKILLEPYLEIFVAFQYTCTVYIFTVGYKIL
jgi:hypothetical protein